MLVHNTTAMLHAARVTSRRPPQPEMSLVVRGAFPLVASGRLAVAEGEFEGDLRAQGTLQGHVFEDDDPEGAPRCPDDLVDYKLGAEVLFTGSCHAPGGEPVTELGVKIGLGDWSKTLRVVGPRRWTDRVIRTSMSKPAPFSSLELGWHESFGGPGVADNPAGKGAEGLELPCVEDPRAPITSPRDRPTPAGFGPLSPAWPARARCQGNAYGKSYEQRRPFYPEDFDWRFFSQAPIDQRLDGYLRGDERLTLVNLHPEHPTIDVELPGLRVRAFARRGGEVVELPMSLDTVWIDEATRAVYLSWRGLCSVGEVDLFDVSAVLIGAEPLNAPRPEADYLAELEAFEADPLGLDAYADLAQQRDDELARLDAALTSLDGVGEGGEDALPDEVGQVLTAVGAENEQVAGAKKSVGDAVAARRTHLPEGKDLADEVKGQKRERRAYPPPLVLVKEGEPLPIPPDRERDAAVDQLRAELTKAREEVAAVEAPAEGAEGLARTEAELSAAEAMLDDPLFAQLRGPTWIEPAPGADLSRQDLREADLRGRDLRGCSFVGAQLGGADLTDAQLTGADLSNAGLVDACLEGAELAGANLYLANLTRTRARGASLRGANLTWTVLESTDLREADLSASTAQTPLVTDVDLTGAKLLGARWTEAMITTSELVDVDASDAELLSCHLIDCDVSRAVFRGALLTKTTFRGSRLAEGDLLGARGERVVFTKTHLDQADFGWAVLPNAFFDEASAKKARLFGANLREARFYRTVLRRADLGRANLFRADLRFADLDRASLRGANLYQAVLEGARGDGCDFAEANLHGARLPR